MRITAIPSPSRLWNCVSRGAIRHEVQARTFLFLPSPDQEQVKRVATRDLLQRVYGGSFGDMVANRIKNERLTRAELNELRLLIDPKRKDEQGAKP